jgi:UDP-N-acetyl-D-mannosaminuronate dehydrogenase
VIGRLRTAREVNNRKTLWAIDQIKIAIADVLVVLVKHRQFSEAGFKVRLVESGALDFCGVLG